MSLHMQVLKTRVVALPWQVTQRLRVHRSACCTVCMGCLDDVCCTTTRSPQKYSLRELRLHDIVSCANLEGPAFGGCCLLLSHNSHRHDKRNHHHHRPLTRLFWPFRALWAYICSFLLLINLFSSWTKGWLSRSSTNDDWCLETCKVPLWQAKHQAKHRCEQFP